MTNTIYILVMSFVALVLQTTFLPLLFSSIGNYLGWDLFAHQTLNLAFLILIYVCVSRDFFSGLFWLFGIVLIQNTFDVSWKGSLAFSYLFLLIGIYLLETVVILQYSISTMAMIFAFIVLQKVLHLLMGQTTMGFEHQYQGEVPAILLSSFLEIAIVPALFFCLYWIDSRTIFHFDRSKGFFGRRYGL